MKRRYDPPELTKYESPSQLPEKLRNLVLLEPAAVHDLLNNLQVITSECEILEQAQLKEIDRLRTIRQAAFRIHDRLLESRKKTA